jgi:uncharacterized surface protein with fasciclin (FAS1) repeats
LRIGPASVCKKCPDLRERNLGSAPPDPWPAGLGHGIKTLEGGIVTPAVMNGTYMVNKASVVCGNVETANATVYIIDTVLMPPAK